MVRPLESCVIAARDPGGLCEDMGLEVKQGHSAVARGNCGAGAANGPDFVMPVWIGQAGGEIGAKATLGDRLACRWPTIPKKQERVAFLNARKLAGQRFEDRGRAQDGVCEADCAGGTEEQDIQGMLGALDHVGRD